MTNPESKVISDIDAMEAEWAAADAAISHNLTTNRGFDDYNREWHDREGELLCDVCLGEWHGLARGNCPGPWATQPEKDAYVAHQRTTHRTIGQRTRNALNTMRSGLTRGGPGVGTVVDPESYGVSITLRSPRGPVLATAEMQSALVDHTRRYPEDEATLMHRFRDLIFTPDGRPVPWTRAGLSTVMGGDRAAVAWAVRQLGIVPLLGSAMAALDETHFEFVGTGGTNGGTLGRPDSVTDCSRMVFHELSDEHLFTATIINGDGTPLEESDLPVEIVTDE